MEVNIERFRFSSLRNIEYALIVARIIRIVDSHDPETLHLSKSLNRVKAFLPDLQRIEAVDRKWHKSQQLNDSEHRRDTMISTLIHTADTFAGIRIPVKTDAAILLNALFDKHGRNIAADTDTAETQRIFNLVKDMEASTELTEALKQLGLEDVFAFMKEANIEFNSLWEERNRDLGEKEPLNIKDMRLKCNKELTALFNAIEHNAIEYDGLDYQPLAGELNAQSIFYRQQLKARMTRRHLNEKEKGNDIRPLGN